MLIRVSSALWTLYCRRHLYRPIHNALVMDLPVNVPVDDPNADTEW